MPHTLAAILAISLFGANGAFAQETGAITQPGTLPYYLDWSSHVLVGVVAAIAGVLVHRAWARRHWREAPAATVNEAVLAIDLVNSTSLASLHGDAIAMRARNFLEQRSLEAGRAFGVTFVESTGDGCMMTFPSVDSAIQAATTLLRQIRGGPPDLAPAPAPEVRAAITYGEILLDSRGGRHAAAINKAFRLMAVTRDAFVVVEGEERLEHIPDRNRVFVDEEAAVGLAGGRIRQAGVCRLKGFNGFHRVFALQWQEDENPEWGGARRSVQRSQSRGAGGPSVG